MANPKFIGPLTGMLTGSSEAGFGVSNTQLAEKIRKRDLDEWKKKWGLEDFETPESYLDELELLKKQQRGEMPGEAEMRRDIDQSGAAMIGSASQVASGADAMAAVLAANQERSRAINQLGAMAAQYKQQRTDAYTQAVGRGAQYDIMEYEYNKWLPAQMKANQVMSLMGVGQTMMASGLDNATANAVNIAGSYMNSGQSSSAGYGQPPADSGGDSSLGAIGSLIGGIFG